MSDFDLAWKTFVGTAIIILLLFFIFSKPQKGVGSVWTQVRKISTGMFLLLAIFAGAALFGALYDITTSRLPDAWRGPLSIQQIIALSFLSLIVHTLFSHYRRNRMQKRILNQGTETLSPYHQKYIGQSETEIQKRIDEKKRELSEIFSHTTLETKDSPVQVAVLGCGDKRFISGHKEIFESILARSVEITTFDITINHLLGEKKVFQHDCTLPLPHGPFDITYAHVLLRFVETEKQWDLIQNSFDALNPGGLAIHVLDTEDYETRTPQLPNGLFSVPLKRWEEKLNELGIKYKKIPVTYGLALVLTKK